jgi:hypothetical protein
MAKEMIDIKLTADEDLDFVAGDFKGVESTKQHQQQLVLNGPGDFKENPTICVGAEDYLDDENPQELLRKVSLEFARDGMNTTIEQKNGQIIAKGSYI